MSQERFGYAVAQGVTAGSLYLSFSVPFLLWLHFVYRFRRQYTKNAPIYVLSVLFSGLMVYKHYRELIPYTALPYYICASVSQFIYGGPEWWI